MVLLGGDEDLRRGLDDAQDHGLKVHLWGVETLTPQYNQSRSLIAEADRRWVMPAEWISRYITLKPESEPVDLAQRVKAIAAQHISRISERTPKRGSPDRDSSANPDQQERPRVLPGYAGQNPWP